MFIHLDIVERTENFSSVDEQMTTEWPFAHVFPLVGLTQDFEFGGFCKSSVSLS